MKIVGDKTDMEDVEGVIKYNLVHQYCALPSELVLDQLYSVRREMFRLKLIGQSAEKYHGLGYGNISQRLHPGKQEFLISGSQTGHLAELESLHFALISDSNVSTNSITSYGLVKPSSEALTHAAVYAQNTAIQAVIHVHSPILWHNTLQLHLPHITADIPYGTPAMATAVAELFHSGKLEQCPLFSMLGHEDGIIAFGSSLTAAAAILTTRLAKI